MTPPKIYLQWHGDGLPEAGSVDHADVTWCADRMNESDVEYVRAEEAAYFQRMNERLIAQLEQQAFYSMRANKLWLAKVHQLEAEIERLKHASKLTAEV